ncbi:FAR1-related sequence 5-like protein [Tanacetum coccineum]
MYGGFENVGVTDVECRNYKHDLTVFIGNRDAQMVVEKLLSRQYLWDNFLFEYKKHKENKTLLGMFWADEQAKQYYDAFGDVVSFDATFRSNRYNMVLVPLTGIDNNNQCILFGAALLASENTKKYSNVEQSVTHLVGDLEKLHLYKDAQTNLMEKAKTDVPNPPKMNTNAVYASTLGVTEPEEVTILPLMILMIRATEFRPGLNQRVKLQ